MALFEELWKLGLWNYGGHLVVVGSDWTGMALDPIQIAPVLSEDTH